MNFKSSARLHYASKFKADRLRTVTRSSTVQSRGPAAGVRVQKKHTHFDSLNIFATQSEVSTGTTLPISFSRPSSPPLKLSNKVLQSVKCDELKMDATNGDSKGNFLCYSLTPTNLFAPPEHSSSRREEYSSSSRRRDDYRSSRYDDRYDSSRYRDRDRGSDRGDRDRDREKRYHDDSSSHHRSSHRDRGRDYTSSSRGEYSSSRGDYGSSSRGEHSSSRGDYSSSRGGGGAGGAVKEEYPSTRDHRDNRYDNRRGGSNRFDGHRGGGGGGFGGGFGGGGYGGRDRKRSVSPKRPRGPTPDLTGIVPIDERKRRLTMWDVKPAGYENVTAEQAKMSGTPLLFIC
jgi:hypothetical protein